MGSVWGLQGLKASTSDLLTMDFRRMSAKGIVSGSWQVPPLADATYCFGVAPPGEGGAWRGGYRAAGSRA